MTRQATARTHLEEGRQLAQSGDLAGAYEAFTAFHDLVLDDPSQHLMAHEELRPVNLALGHAAEARTDRVLIALAPLGVFRLITLYFRLEARLKGGALYED